MHKHRGTLTILALAALSAAALAAYLPTRWFVGLPDPQTADLAGVVHWLVRVDLAGEPLELRQTLVGRIEVVCRPPLDVDGAGGLSDDQRRRLQANARLLQEDWFRMKTVAYWQCEPSQRSAFLDEQLRMIEQWLAVDRQLGAAGGDGTPASSGGSLSTFLSTIETWIAETPLAERPKTSAVVEAAFLRWLATVDLKGESAEGRRAIVDRVQSAGVQGESLDEQLPALASDGSRFWNNVMQLAEVWFADRSRQYGQLVAADRPEFLVEQLDFIEEVFFTSKSAGANTGEWQERFDDWIAQGNEAERIDRRAFAQNLRAGLLVRRLQRMWKEARG